MARHGSANVLCQTKSGASSITLDAYNRMLWLSAAIRLTSCLRQFDPPLPPSPSSLRLICKIVFLCGDTGGGRMALLAGRLPSLGNNTDIMLMNQRGFFFSLRLEKLCFYISSCFSYINFCIDVVFTIYGVYL